MRANLFLRESPAGAVAGSSVAVSVPVRPAAPAARPVARARGLLERIDDWFWRLRQREIDRYLASSQDLCELEQRMRDLARGAPHPYY